MEAMAIVRAINGSNNWSIDHILQYIKFMDKAFLKQLKSLNFIPRRQNPMAHNMARCLLFM